MSLLASPQSKETPSLGSLRFAPAQAAAHPIKLDELQLTDTTASATAAGQQPPTALSSHASTASATKPITVFSQGSPVGSKYNSNLASSNGASASAMPPRHKAAINVRHPSAHDLVRRTSTSKTATGVTTTTSTYTHPVALQMARAATRISKDSSMQPTSYNTPGTRPSAVPRSHTRAHDTPTAQLNAALNNMHKSDALPDSLQLQEEESDCDENGVFNPYLRRYSLEKEHTITAQSPPKSPVSPQSNDMSAVVPQKQKSGSILRFFSMSSTMQSQAQPAAAVAAAVVPKSTPVKTTDKPAASVLVSPIHGPSSIPTASRAASPVTSAAAAPAGNNSALLVESERTSSSSQVPVTVQLTADSASDPNTRSSVVAFHPAPGSKPAEATPAETRQEIVPAAQPTQPKRMCGCF